MKSFKNLYILLLGIIFLINLVYGEKNNKDVNKKVRRRKCIVDKDKKIYLDNQLMLKKDLQLIRENPMGQLVEVDGHLMNIYSEGKGNHTIVFLSGLGTPTPIIDFRALCRLLSNDYRIAVVEKFGYGYSDIVDMDRSLDTMIRQDREALVKAGIEGPYILCPHSISGIEAIRWAQLYPSEVEALIGLDISLPEEGPMLHEVYNDSARIESEKARYKSGEARHNKEFEANFELFEKVVKLTPLEIDLYRAFYYYLTDLNTNISLLREFEKIGSNCQTAQLLPKPDIPTYLFFRYGPEFVEQNSEIPEIAQIVQMQNNYAEGLTSCKVLEFNSAVHYVHNAYFDIINEEIRNFIKEYLD